MVRLVRGAFTRDPCETCAFRDPEAWIADSTLPTQLETCLRKRQPFYCHHGMERAGEDGVEYQPPRRADGTIATEKLEMCAGFARLVARDGGDTEQLMDTIRTVRRKLLKRFAEAPTDEYRDLVAAYDGNAELLACMLDIMKTTNATDDVEIIKALMLAKVAGGWLQPRSRV